MDGRVCTATIAEVEHEVRDLENSEFGLCLPKEDPPTLVLHL